jgi:hypothetical protein
MLYCIDKEGKNDKTKPRVFQLLLEESRKEREKNLKKILDKYLRTCYNINVEREDNLKTSHYV